MNPKQWQWLTNAASWIPELFAKLENGSDIAETTLGVRVINGQQVRLFLRAEVVGTGRNPLASHASANYPNTSKPRITRPNHDLPGTWPRDILERQEHCRMCQLTNPTNCD